MDADRHVQCFTGRPLWKFRPARATVWKSIQRQGGAPVRNTIQYASRDDAQRDSTIDRCAS
jgi:hypothetical protein